MLMMNIAMGGMGGSVAAAMARALGAGRLDDSRGLVVHALVFAVASGLVFTAFAWSMAPGLYALMGGVGGALEAAVAYSHVWFAGAVLLWLFAFLSSLLRGGGDAATPGLYGLASSIVYVPLAGILALGIGPWPGLGLVGRRLPAWSRRAPLCCCLGVSSGRQAGLRAGICRRPPAAPVVRRNIARGLLGSLTTLTANATAMGMAGLVRRFGVAALAGYGIGVRLEFMVAPIAFGIGTGLTTLVGAAAGAGAWRRAVRATWIAGLVSFGVIGLIGWTVALMPESWARLFTSDAEVVAASAAYITRVAPFYCLFGLALTLYFASQGAGRMAVPAVAGVVRMIATILAGWLAVEKFGLGLEGVFAAIAVGMAVYGGLMAGLLLLTPWGPRQPRFK